MENSFRTSLLNARYLVVKRSELIKSVKIFAVRESLLNFLKLFVLRFSKTDDRCNNRAEKLEHCIVAINNLQAILIREHKRHASNIFA
jgi:hypothetical protein